MDADRLEQSRQHTQEVLLGRRLGDRPEQQVGPDARQDFDRTASVRGIEMVALLRASSQTIPGSARNTHPRRNGTRSFAAARISSPFSSLAFWSASGNGLSNVRRRSPVSVQVEPSLVSFPR